MRFILLTYAITLTCLTMVAQPTQKATQPLPKKTQPGEAYSNAEFDPTVAHLPAGFNGHDIRRLTSELEKADSAMEKREFESTEQWKDRLRLAEAQPIIGNLKRDTTYAFVVERYTAFKDWNDERAKGLAVIEESKATFEALIDATHELTAARRLSHTEAAEQIRGYIKDQFEQLDRATKIFDAQALIERNLIATSDPVTAEEKKRRVDAIRASDERRDSPATAVHVTYDADRARFDITIQADAPSFAGGSTLRIVSGPATSSVYMGSNGFGAVEEVQEFGFKEYKLLIANSLAVPFVASLAPKRIHVEVPIFPENAKEVKRQIQVIAICKLAATFTTSGKVHKEPTHDDPISINVDHKYVKVNILSIWIYNYDTGTVYARIRPSDAVR